MQLFKKKCNDGGHTSTSLTGKNVLYSHLIISKIKNISSSRGKVVRYHPILEEIREIKSGLTPSFYTQKIETYLPA